MAYPDLEPTSRSVSLGDWPVKTFRSQAGKEVRVLYGNRRTGAELQLTYENIADGDANGFLSHYEDMRGTYDHFTVGAATSAGWERNRRPGTTPFTEPQASRYRFAEAPQIASVRPGRSTVTVRLVSVLQ